MAGRGLSYKAQLDTTEALKKAKELKKAMSEMSVGANGSLTTSKAFDVKPLTTYQAGILKIKQETLELAKVKQAQAAADKSASLVTQEALKQERLALIALKAEQKAKKPAQISNSQAEIDAYNNVANGSSKATLAINEQNKAQAQLANSAVAVTTATANQGKVVASTNLSRKQAAKLLAEEKYIQQQATRELKNNIREQLNAKGSLEQRRAALIRLNIAYDRLSVAERGSAAGGRLQGIIARTTEQVKGLESATGRAQRNVGNYTSAIGRGFTNVYGKVKLLANIIPGLGISGVILLALAPITALISKLDIFKTSLDNLSKPKKALNESYKESANLIAKETGETTLLVNKINDKNLSETKRQDLLNEFINKNPSVLGALNLQNIATFKGTQIVNDYIIALRKKIELQQLEAGYTESLQKQADIKSGKEDTGLGWLGKSLIVGNKIMTGFQNESIGQAFDKANKRFKAQAEIEQEAVVKGFEAKIKATVEGNAKVAEVEDTSLKAAEDRLSNINDRLRNLQKGESDKTLKQQKAQLEKEIKQRSEGLGLGSKAEIKAQATAVKRQRTLQAEIDSYTKKGLASKEDADKQEIVSVEEKYKKLREKAIAFNSAKDSKGQKVNLSGINAAEDAEKKEISHKKEAKDLKVSLDTQADLYAAYEDLKTKIGKEKADARYVGQIQTDKTYLEDLYEQQANMLGTKGKGSADEEVANKLALKVLEDRIDAQKLIVQKADDDKYAKALEAAKTLTQSLIEVEKDYQEKVSALGSAASKEQLEKLAKDRDKSVSKLAVDELTGSDAFTKLFSDLDTLTAKEIDKLLKEIESKFSTLSVKFNPIDLAAIRKKLEEAKQVMIADNPFKQVGESIKAVFNDGADGAKKSSQQIKADWKKLGESTAASFDFVNDAINSADFLKEAIGEVGATAISSLMTIATVSLAVTTAIKTAEKASVILAIVGAALAVIQAIASVFKGIFNKHDKDIEKSISKHEDQVTKLSNAYNQLERDINNSVGKSVKKAQEDQIANLKAQQAELIKMRQAEIDKKKTDDSKVADYEERIAQLDQDVIDLKKSMNEALTGTTSKSITDSIIQGFKDGKRSIADFADTFKDLMKGALYAALQEDLEPEIEAFYKRFIEASKDGLTDTEYNNLQKDYEKIVDKQLDKVAAIDKITGGNKPGSADTTTSTLTGDIKSITTEQAGVLTGTMNGMRLAQLDGNRLLTEGNKVRFDAYSIAKGNFDLTVKIEQNTANTVQRLDTVVTELVTLNRKVGSNAQALAANGR